MRLCARLAISTTVVLLLAACNGQPIQTLAPTASARPPTAAPTPTERPTPPPTPSPVPELGIDLVSDGPVLVGSDLEAGDHYNATLPAAYSVADGVHHAYVVGFGDAPGDQQVFHLTSADGLGWTLDGNDPFADLGLEASPPGPIPGSVIQVDGEWVMYLWAVPVPQIEGAQIYRATAPGPGGPWTADPEPVLAVGDPGEVDDGGLDFPAVVETDDGFVMLYGANGGDHPNEARILLARSDDGVTWEKAGRVLEPEVCGGQSTDFIAIPRLFSFDGGYLALTLLDSDIAAVRSLDAVEWTCAADGPAFLAGQIQGSDRVHTVAAAQVGDGINVIIEALMTAPDGVVGSELWLAEVTGL